MRIGAGIPLAILVAAGCADSPVEPTLGALPPPDARPYVAGAALASLDTNGHFRIPAPSVEGGHPMITAAEAKAIAEALIRAAFANPNVYTPPSFRSLTESVEEEHGAPVDWPSVRAGPREPYFAESHLEPLSDTLGSWLIRHYGPHFLVPMYEDATPVAVVGVAAYATNLFVNDRGRLETTTPLGGGGEFRVSGIPLALGGLTSPPSPEAAVKFAFERTGARTVDVPVLGTPGNRIVRTAARWRLRLERPVELELVDGRTVTSDEVYVAGIRLAAIGRGSWDGPRPARLRLLVAAAEQPDVQTDGPARFTIRDGYAVDLHEVRTDR